MGFLEFKQKLIFTGSSERKSKKGFTYTLINFLDDAGESFSCMSDLDYDIKCKQLDKVNVHFKVVPGRYTQLRVLDISPAS